MSLLLANISPTDPIGVEFRLALRLLTKEVGRFRSFVVSRLDVMV